MRALKGVRHLTLISDDPQVSSAPGDRRADEVTATKGCFVPLPGKSGPKGGIQGWTIKALRRKGNGLTAADGDAPYLLAGGGLKGRLTRPR